MKGREREREGGREEERGGREGKRGKVGEREGERERGSERERVREREVNIVSTMYICACTLEKGFVLGLRQF